MSASNDQTLSVDEVTRKVRIMKLPLPEYTEEARESKIEGVIVLRLVCRSFGKVTDVQVMQRLPHGLTTKAVEAARKIEFEPASKDGQAVSQWVTIK